MEMSLDVFIACAGIYALAFVHFLAAIPAGLALGLPPWAVIFCVVSSYITSAALLIYLGEGLRAWLVRRFAVQPPPDDSRIYRIWQRWGVAGYGFTTPVTVGSQLGVLIGLLLQASSRSLFLWMALGAVFWATAATVALRLGWVGLQSFAGI